MNSVYGRPNWIPMCDDFGPPQVATRLLRLSDSCPRMQAHVISDDEQVPRLHHELLDSGTGFNGSFELPQQEVDVRRKESEIFLQA